MPGEGPARVERVDAFAAVRRSPTEFAREMRVAGAILWYAQGMISQDKAASIASMVRVRGMIAKYQAKLFINHDKAQSDILKLLPAFYD